ncbi:MAG: hypothetical protein LBR22_02515 [Desulfovibrio sp.]|jgi:hypothetical protein|nr:hypothetical protein [Desulfovibrio sp.]
MMQPFRLALGELLLDRGAMDGEEVFTTLAPRYEGEGFFSSGAVLQGLQSLAATGIVREAWGKWSLTRYGEDRVRRNLPKTRQA